jgi:CPA2 family monovalent cation:H+ antiporter-2
VLVSGWGGAAHALAVDLHDTGVPVVVVTLNPDGAAQAEQLGLSVVRGDSTKEHVLRTAGADRARLVVVADDEPEQAARIAGVVAAVAPQAELVVMTTDSDAVAELHGAGAASVVDARSAAHRQLVHAVRTRLAPPATTGRTVVDVDRVVAFAADPDGACVHAGTAHPVLPSAPGCEECLRTGAGWVHLRVCTSCGHVGCCDSSPGRHAAAHASADDHPVMCSAEPGEDWGWCYLDRQLLPRA